jgi:ABC-2 type transport system ATP-binding protein
VIDIREVTKSYGKLQVLAGVSLAVPPGSALGLVGPNGAGKSTLLRIVCGLARADNGQVLLNGRDSADEPTARRSLGCMPETLPLFDLLTGREQLLWTCSILGVARSLAERRIAELAGVLELSDALDKPIGTLSTGTRKKLAFAAALAGDPRLLVLDEPFEGVDLLGIYTMKDILAQCLEAGAALLISSHILPLLEDVCSTFALLHHGRIVLHGDRETLRSRALEVTHGAGAERGDLESVFLDIVAPGRRSRRLKTLAGVTTE